MGRAIRGVWVMLGAIATVTACSVQGTPTANSDYAHVSASRTQLVTAGQLAGAENLVASPDGGTLFFVTGGRPCLWTLADDSRTCAPKDKVVASAASARWAPDGSVVAFTDDYLQTAHEPDLWVMRRDGSISDITNDHIGGSLLSANDDALIDVQPAWLDSTTILFVRQHGWHGVGMDISKISVGGGAVSTLSHIDRNVQFLNAMAVSPTGDTLAYSLAGDNLTSAVVHLRSLADGTDSVVLRSTWDESLLSFSPDGKFLLADSKAPAMQYQLPKDSGAVAVTVADHSTTPVVKSGGDWWPTWSPTGHALAFLTAPNKAGATLKMVAEPAGTVRKLLSDTRIRPTWQLVGWTPSGILLRTPKAIVVVTVTTS